MVGAKHDGNAAMQIRDLRKKHSIRWPAGTYLIEGTKVIQTDGNCKLQSMCLFSGRINVAIDDTCVKSNGNMKHVVETEACHGGKPYDTKCDNRETGQE
jgi:hypothetical protein